MLNLKKVTDSAKGSVKNLKHQAEHLGDSISESTHDLNKKIQDGAVALEKGFSKPANYNYLIFALPIVLILLALIPMPVWLLQIIRLVITCCTGYVLFYEWRLDKKREKVFFIALALTILFNPLIPFYVPGMPINIITIAAICYMAYVTQQGKKQAAVHHRANATHGHSTHKSHAHTSHSAHKDEKDAKAKTTAKK